MNFHGFDEAKDSDAGPSCVEEWVRKSGASHVQGIGMYHDQEACCSSQAGGNFGRISGNRGECESDVMAKSFLHVTMCNIEYVITKVTVLKLL
ncbi:hypothetical protein BGAL_0088g00210 [Botrytis galanthina]|uniref:Uncharacterized protein n=1 Tax=Botrytis galanthina TaxID=278940 RepID=A0A4S8R5P4_9HELO|nr:hypothetical protein BGAL_0088g00210 [Botrytis galanthina]